MRTILFCLLLAGCKDAKTKQCEEVRDRYLNGAEQRLQEAAKQIEPERRQQMLDQNHKELASFKDRFVDVCKKTENLDFACFTGPESKVEPTKACRDMLEPIWKQTYGN